MGRDLGLGQPGHARRKLHEVSQTGTTPIAEEGLKQIGELYRIENDIRGLSPDASVQAARAPPALPPPAEARARAPGSTPSS